MGSFTGSAVFSAAVFFYCLGLIFGVVGYIGAWLEPREVTKEAIQSIGVRTACFAKQTVPDGETDKFDNSQQKLTVNNFKTIGELAGESLCYDTTKNSLAFSELPTEYVSPDWYQMVQDVYLASLILIFLTLILVIGFLISYLTLKQQIKRRRRPSSTLLLSKAALGLWFILAAVAGCLLIVGPSVFFKNYEREDTNLFTITKDNYKYGAGFAITIAGGASLLVSTLFGLIVFVTVVKKMHRLSSGDAKDEFDNLDANDTEMERLSNDEIDRDDDTGNSKSRATTKKAYPVAAPRHLPPSTEEPEGVSYQNIPKRQSERQQEEAAGGLAYQNIATPRPKSSAGPIGPPQPAKRLSVHGNPDKKREAPEQFQKVDYNQPPRDISPAPGNRSMAGESMASSAYPPSTHYSYSPYMQNRDPHSDSEFSQRSGRNRTVTRANQGDNSSVASSNIPKPVVIQAGRTPDVKHSRYAAAF